MSETKESLGIITITQDHIDEYAKKPIERVSVGEFSEAFNGGLVKGALTILHGADRVKRTTLAWQIASEALKNSRVLYVGSEPATIRDDVLNIANITGRGVGIDFSDSVDSVGRISAYIAYDNSYGRGNIMSLVIIDFGGGVSVTRNQIISNKLLDLKKLAKERSIAVLALLDETFGGQSTIDVHADVLASLDQELKGKVWELHVRKSRFGPDMIQSILLNDKGFTTDLNAPENYDWL